MSPQDVADRAAQRAGVVIRTVEDIEDLRAVAALLESVWGRTTEGVPLPSEVMRSLAHAGGATTAAYAEDGTLVAAASLAVAAPPGTTYSLIAAVAPGGSDRGTGLAVKLHQRAWALAHGFDIMVWTFDPLVGRNARFNLAKLGAVAGEYAASFYGRMSDEVNGDDDSDRLVARWVLGSPRAVAAAEGRLEGSARPADGARPGVVGPGVVGPDGAVMTARDDSGRWVRVPRDIVALRRQDPAQAAAWRHAVREAVTDAFGSGLVAVHLTRDGWYHLAERPPDLVEETG